MQFRYNILFKLATNHLKRTLAIFVDSPFTIDQFFPVHLGDLEETYKKIGLRFD